MATRQLGLDAIWPDCHDAPPTSVLHPGPIESAGPMSHSPAALATSFRFSLFGLAVLSAVQVGCRSPYAADRGALLGGLTGAGLGAWIGADHDREVEGAILGSAAGAVTGAVAGTLVDNRRAAEQQASDAAAASSSVSGSHAVTIDEVVRMSQAGLSDHVITEHIRAKGVATGLSTPELIHMKSQGVSEPVLVALQQLASAPPSTPSPTVVPVPVAPPVVVEQHVVAQPVLSWGYHRPHRRVHAPRRPRPGFHWGISLSN